MTNTRTNTLRRLPSELRVQIFKYLFEDFEWKGKMPSIVKALRGDLVVYYEALAAFHKTNSTYILSERNNWGFRIMSKPMITTIGKVTIEMSQSLYPDRTALDLSREEYVIHKSIQEKSQRRFHKKKQSPHIANRQDLRSSAAALKNVREVTLYYPPNTIPTRHKYDIIDLYDFFVGFSRLRKITLFCASATMREVDQFSRYRFNLPAMGNEIFGVEGAVYKDVQISCDDGRSPPIAWDKEWVWEAEEGGYLKEVKPRPPYLGFWKDTWVLLKVTVEKDLLRL